MFDIILPSRRAYLRIRQLLISSARKQLEQGKIDPNQTIMNILHKGLTVAITGGGPQVTPSGVSFFTTRQLEGALRLLFNEKPEIAAFLIMVVLPELLPAVVVSGDDPRVTYNLPRDFNGDTMIGLQNVRAFAPADTSKSANIIAHALCMMRSLEDARGTFRSVGVPYSTAPLDNKSITKLLKEKVIPPGTMPPPNDNGQTILKWDTIIRDEVVAHLTKLSNDAARLIAEI
jgi:hypothetical protein